VSGDHVGLGADLRSKATTDTPPLAATDATQIGGTRLLLDASAGFPNASASSGFGNFALSIVSTSIAGHEGSADVAPLVETDLFWQVTERATHVNGSTPPAPYGIVLRHSVAASLLDAAMRHAAHHRASERERGPGDMSPPGRLSTPLKAGTTSAQARMPALIRE
jgi:hypothetical protein